MTPAQWDIRHGEPGLCTNPVQTAHLLADALALHRFAAHESTPFRPAGCLHTRDRREEGSRNSRSCDRTSAHLTPRCRVPSTIASLAPLQPSSRASRRSEPASFLRPFYDEHVKTLAPYAPGVRPLGPKIVFASRSSAMGLQCDPMASDGPQLVSKAWPAASPGSLPVKGRSLSSDGTKSISLPVRPSSV